jgi:hypothetical protein
MKISEIVVQQVGYGREYLQGSEKRRDYLARCLDVGTGGNLGAASFFDVRVPDTDIKEAGKLVGKQIEVSGATLRQPFAGAPFAINGTIKVIA